MCTAAWPDNLLGNPGFEVIDAGRPAQWDVFVLPQPGAEGGLDDEIAYQGRYSVRLHTPEPYEREPLNNWSQSIRADVAGKTLVVRGTIKAAGVTGAALWLQCWRRDPLCVCHVAATSTKAPVSGTTAWTPVEMDVSVPEGTDFVVLRCVLKGTGTAWFDDLSLEEKVPQPAETANKTSSDQTHSHAVTAGQTAQGLIEANREMAEAIRALRATNQNLAEQLTELQKDLRMLREYIGRTSQAAVPQSPAELRQARPARSRVPPLVPHGYNSEEDP